MIELLSCSMSRKLAPLIPSASLLLLNSLVRSRSVLYELDLQPQGAYMLLTSILLVWLLEPIFRAPALSLVVVEIHKKSVLRGLCPRFVVVLHIDRCQALGKACASREIESLSYEQPTGELCSGPSIHDCDYASRSATAPSISFARWFDLRILPGDVEARQQSSQHGDLSKECGSCIEVHRHGVA